MVEAAKFGKAQPAGRLEDRRFLTGQGRYVDDIAPAGALYAYFLRSNQAHGRITALDLDAAREMPGVRLVLDAAGLEGLGVTLGMRGAVLTNRDGFKGAAPERPVLARGIVRHVGEAVAVIVAETMAQALDAAEAIWLEIEDEPVSLALKPGGPTIHPEAPGNLAYDWGIGNEPAAEAAFASAVHVVTLEVVHNRVIVNPMEPRGCYAEWDGARLHLCVNGQGVWNQRNETARMLGLPREAIRVTNPDVGGGFGMKAMTYPEYIVVAAAALTLGQAVRWTAGRTESMLTDNAGRDLVALAELALDAGHRITGYRVNLVSNLGAYNSQFAQPIQSELFSKVLTGTYDIQAAYMRAVGVYTNTAPVDAYRGAGRPEAILTLERVMDEAARVLGLDPFEFREKNVIRTFPYRTVVGEVIDVGDFPRILSVAKARGDVAGFAARKAESASRGKLRGLGVATYIECILGDPSETARLVLEPEGASTLYVGTQSNGQGHETVYARMVADQTGLDPEKVRVVQGDSDAIPTGGGTGGSRSVTVQGTAMKATINALLTSFAAFLTEEWDIPEVTFDGQSFGGTGTNKRMTLAEAADLARTKGRQDLLDTSRQITLEGRSFPNGAHLAEIEIDPETGSLVLDRYTVVDDFGVLIAPELAIGQVHGGVVQGFGQAVTENAVHDAAGQLLTASFMDYAMPRADDLPMIDIGFEPVPSVANPLGMKGCGEAGTVGALGAVSNAVRDALAEAGVKKVDMPFTPSRVWHWLMEAQNGTD
ncbi:xanthine dehydrogenase family protein molybdopterin-binding subunit [Thioclava sp. FR2]|uniref:xanthine dehydrogenase family protein molybdopterin-binding subunit n=1 Tax=Thioclava sp. FR2 TaxID=3445780 RepID=UPI003EBCE2F6